MNELMTYVMTDGDLFKIGKSINPKARLSQLRSGNPKLTMVFFGTGVTEKQLHKMYKKKRVTLEWFNLDMEDVAEIRSLFTIMGEQIDICDDLLFPKYVIGMAGRMELKEMLGAKTLNDEIIAIFIFFISSYNSHFSTSPTFMKHIANKLDIDIKVFKLCFQKLIDINAFTECAKHVYLINDEAKARCEKYIQYLK